MGREDLTMQVTQPFSKDGEKYAFVQFSDGERLAEGKIPDCKILSSKGFTEEEVADLEKYMQGNLAQLKKMAAGVRPIDAFLKQ